MSTTFLSGILAAWATAQVAVGAFFLLARVLRQREAEYLLFGLVCFALAVMTGAVSAAYVVPEERFLRVSSIAHGAAIVAVAVNVHFAVRYYGRLRARWLVPAIYVLAVVFTVANLSGLWWVDEEVGTVESSLFGPPIRHFTAVPTPLATVWYVFSLGQLCLVVVLFYLAFERGKREALPSLLGGIVVLVSTLNDVLVVTGRIESEYLLPHGFLIYAFAVGSTLLFRYQSAAGQLETTVDDLRSTTRELRSSYAELKLVQSELVKKEQLAAVGELAAMIAHEVRNPLAIIKNAAASLRRARIREEDRDMLLGIVDEETERLNRLVSDLLRFARPVNVNVSSISIRELLERAADAAITTREVSIEVTAEGEPSEVAADPGLVRLVIDNLIANACQAMPNGGTVRIVVGEADDGQVRVDVVDEGEGMDDDVLHRAIDPFFTTRPSGTGLGLPIVERIIEAHGGTLNIESVAGRGTTVSLLLPAAGPPSTPRPSLGDEMATTSRH